MCKKSDFQLVCISTIGCNLKINNKMELGQYYTPENFSTLLVSSMHSADAESVLDIGCGQASLLKAARNRWKNAKLIGYDIDPRNFNVVGSNLHIEFGNGFDADLSRKIIDTFGHIDISVANPPYISVEINRDISEILKRSRISECIPPRLKKLPSEIVFLAQNMLVLKKGGELGAILPASIISGEKWKNLREFLITELSLNKVIQLPQKAFGKTEASTFAVNFKNTPSTGKNVSLHSVEDMRALKVNKESGTKRLDYSYHINSHQKKIKSTASREILLVRGDKSSKLLKKFNKNYLHTSNLKETFQTLEYGNNTYALGTKIACKGDFVVSRVGSRCIGKTGYIEDGCVEVSDCITVIKKIQFEKYISFFISGQFYKEVSQNALGTGAKYLTFDIILEALEAYEF